MACEKWPAGGASLRRGVIMAIEIEIRRGCCIYNPVSSMVNIGERGDIVTPQPCSDRQTSLIRNVSGEPSERHAYAAARGGKMALACSRAAVASAIAPAM